MGWLDRFLSGRRELLATSEPERAFAPDPSSDTWPLVVDGDNAQAIEAIRRDGLKLVAAASGEVRSISEFGGGVLLLATVWEPYSAVTIGALRGPVEAGEIRPFAVVFFENTRDEVVATKSDAWYFAHAFVLAPESGTIRSLIRRVPLRIFIGLSGEIECVVEGKA
jgi:hypothetical protein